jgi:hypothetical protein
MRTTVELDPDTQKAIEAIRREEGLGVSEAVNELIRRGLTAPRNATTYRPIHRDLGLRIDVSNVADALDFLEGPRAR